MTKLSKQKQDPQLRQTAVSGSRFVPMLFSTDMVQAILNGTKTETRRIIDLKNDNMLLVKKESGNKKLIDKIGFVAKQDKSVYEFVKQKILFGDIIWVRETFFDATNFQDATLFKQNSTIIYKADETFIGFHKWKPSLFMPKKACRIFLKVVSVSVEQLQNIDEQSAINEGIENLSAKELNYDIFRNYLRSENEEDFQDAITDNPIYSYKTLWQKINGKDSWEKNPFVWVYKFRCIPVPPDFC